MVSEKVLRWLLHDLASPVATVLTASEMLGPDEDQELRDMVTGGAKRLAARLRLLRMAFAPGESEVAGPALAKLISEGALPAVWGGDTAAIPGQRASALAALALTLGWTEVTLTADAMRGTGRPQEPVLAALAGFEADNGAAEVASLAGKVKVAVSGGAVEVVFPS